MEYFHFTRTTYHQVAKNVVQTPFHKLFHSVRYKRLNFQNSIVMSLTLNFIMQYRSVSVQSRHFVELNTNENLNSIERFELSTKQWPRCGLMHQFAVYFPYYFEKQFHIDCLNAS